MNKTLSIFLILGILLIGIFSVMDFEDKQGNVFDCNNPDIIFLKANEKHLSGKIANEIHGIAVIPEENYLVADTELLTNCDNIDFKKYLRGGDYF